MQRNGLRLSSKTQPRQIIGEKDSDGSLSLFTLLAFLHSVSLQQEVWGKKKNHFYFSAWIPIPSLLLWLLECQLTVYTAAAILAGKVFPYIVVKA